ncbi:MAG TPA: hypothetical protein VGF82_16490 [Terracidiphilus sp.]|jgi:hypothetical protein
MNRIPQFVLIGAMAVFTAARGNAQAQHLTGAEVDLTASPSTRDLTGMPPLPNGASTILGGTLREVDPVLDRFTLRIVGEKPMKILYDERTQVFVDGKRIPLNQLRAAEHASVQTTLDGTTVFAISVHILSQLQQGDYRGEVVSYDPASGNLDVVPGKGGEPIRVRVSPDTKFDRKGQGTFTSSQSSPADLQRGALVSLRFDPDGKGRATATQISLLAVPGSKFVFTGNLMALDMHAGNLMLLDPRNDQDYEIEFEPGVVQGVQNVHAGQRVRISAEYDGTRYLAQDVTAY